METYENVEDLECEFFCGIALKWNYAKHHVNLAMVKYIMKQMTKYGHVAPLKPQHCPYSPNPIKYGKNNQTPSPLNVIGHGILAGTYLAEYRDSLK